MTNEQPPIELAVINVVQPQPRTCQERDLTVNAIGAISVVATQHTRGDRDFVAHGPRITIRVDIAPKTSRVSFQATMTAIETVPDTTTFTGTRVGELAVSPPVPVNHVITQIRSSTSAFMTYTDTDHADDVFEPATGLVSQFVVVGDTDGADLGRTRLVSATLRPLQIHVVETGNCVRRR